MSNTAHIGPAAPDAHGETVSLADRNFREYLIAVLCGNVGVQIAFLAISWHIFILTHQPFDLGLIGFTMFLPALDFAIPAGKAVTLLTVAPRSWLT